MRAPRACREGGQLCGCDPPLAPAAAGAWPRPSVHKSMAAEEVSGRGCCSCRRPRIAPALPAGFLAVHQACTACVASTRPASTRPACLTRLVRCELLPAQSLLVCQAISRPVKRSLARRVQALLPAKAADIARLLRSNRCDVQLLAAPAALLVAYDERAVPSLLAVGGVEALVSLCSSSSASCQKLAAQALAGLANYSSSVPSLIAAAGATAAVQQALRCASSTTNMPQEARWSMQALGDALAGLPSPSVAAPSPPPAQPAALPRPRVRRRGLPQHAAPAPLRRLRHGALLQRGVQHGALEGAPCRVPPPAEGGGGGQGGSS